jgi:hypothetical protein
MSLQSLMSAGRSAPPVLTFFTGLLLAIGSCGFGGINSQKLEGTYEAEIALAQSESSDSNTVSSFTQGLANLALKTASVEFNFYDGGSGSVYANFGIFELLRAFAPQPGARSVSFNYKVDRNQQLLIKPEGKESYSAFARIERYSKDYKYIRLMLSNDEDGQMLYIDLKKTE